MLFVYFFLAGASGGILAAGLGSMIGGGFEGLYGLIGALMGMVFLYFGMRVLHLLDTIEEKLGLVKWPWNKKE